MTKPDGNLPDSPDASPVSRRDFLFRAGQVGAALSVVGPMFSRRVFAESGLAPALNHGILGSTAALAQEPVALYSGLHWRMLGPFRGGRTDAVTGVPGRPNEFYFGSVNGGLWKSIDAGRVWTPVFDSQPVASIGAVAVAPSAPDTVWVGSGESTLRDSMGFGNGVYKSTDGGQSWTHMGLDDTQHIGKIAVDPKNPNIVFVAAIGHLYAASPDRGVFRTIDGGKTWTKVLYKDDNVGAIEVVVDPTNSKVVYAGLWNTRRPPWFTYRPSNGPGGGIYKSTDGGTTWKQLEGGLPNNGMGKSGIAVSPSNPKRVYAVIDNLEEGAPAPAPVAPPPAAAAGAGAGAAAGGAAAGGAAAAGRGGRGARGGGAAGGAGGGGGGGGRGGGGGGGGGGAGQGGFFRSDDAGLTWTKMSSDMALWGRGWYFEHIAVDPKNPDIVYVPNVAVSRTKDGGKTWVALRGSPGGDDYHQAWVSPDDSNTMIVASDQGTIITRNATTEDPKDVTWSSWLNQPTAQIYHVDVDYRLPYWVHGAQQDSGAVAVCSRGKFAEISEREWEPIGAGGESGYTAGDPLHPGIIYGGTGSRFDLALNTSAPGSGAPGGGRKDWTAPLVISKLDPRILYYGSENLYRTTDGAESWEQISNDLTRPDPGTPANLDAAAAADINVSTQNGRRGVIYTIAPSPLLLPMVWIGTDDGYIQVTTNGGKAWQNVTPPAMTAWSRVTMMEASHFDYNTAYASVDRHQLQDFDPYLYRTRDMGKTWQRISTGLPAGIYVHSVKEDPQRQGLLFAGTERGVFVSFDDGDHWQTLQLNLPTCSMRDFVIYNNDIVVGTHGRGFWVIDDISPLRQVNPSIIQSDAYLFKPADAIEYVQGGDNGTPLQKDEPQALNPQNGAAIDYYLKSDATGPVTIDILDEAGASVRTFTATPGAAAGAGGGRGGGRGGGGGGGIPNTSDLWRATPEPFSASAGMHRVYFSAAGGGRGGGGGGGGGGGRGGGRGRGGGSTLPATYTAKLTVNGKSYTQTFTLLPDPRRKEIG